jgi:hypothetical protein
MSLAIDAVIRATEPTEERVRSGRSLPVVSD